MNRSDLIRTAVAAFDRGDFARILARRVACASESQRNENGAILATYLRNEVRPILEMLGFVCHFPTVSAYPDMPFLVAERIEDTALPTLMSYAHGDVVLGDEEHWRAGLNPWQLVEEGERLYGRGCADNKGQHTINLLALEHVIRARGGRLGFNCKLLFEMGEEISSPGLADLCREHAALLAADVFIASDGPRLSADKPTLFLGSRGCVNFRLSIRARSQFFHSGNWGGLLSNPGTQLANAIASLIDGRGRLQLDSLLPPSLTPALREILDRIVPGGNLGDPVIDPDWGAEGLTAAERLLGWNALEVLSFVTGNPAKPANAIPPHATAVCQLRFVVGTDWENLADNVRAHLASHGFGNVDVEILNASPATRLDPHGPLVEWTLAIMREISGKTPVLLPNLGGSLPNDVFADILGLPTLWIPHSYPACGQHAVDEHLLKPVAREGLAIMAGLFWELGEQGSGLLARHREYTART